MDRGSLSIRGVIADVPGVWPIEAIVPGFEDELNCTGHALAEFETASFSFCCGFPFQVRSLLGRFEFARQVRTAIASGNVPGANVRIESAVHLSEEGVIEGKAAEFFWVDAVRVFGNIPVPTRTPWLFERLDENRHRWEANNFMAR